MAATTSSRGSPPTHRRPSACRRSGGQGAPRAGAVGGRVPALAVTCSWTAGLNDWVGRTGDDTPSERPPGRGPPLRPGISVRVEPCILMRPPQHPALQRACEISCAVAYSQHLCITILMTSIRNAGVLGASGYAGAELLRLLAGHPDLDVAWAAGDQAAGQPLVTRYLGLRRLRRARLLHRRRGPGEGADVIFCALPHGRSAEVAARALAAAAVVVDLSPTSGSATPAPTPSGTGPSTCSRPARRLALRPARAAPRRAPGASRVAVPGRYPTAALLALAPLVASGLIATEGIVVDAKSGLSGPGASLTDPTCSSRPTRTSGSTRCATATPRRSSRSWPWPPGAR